MNKTELIAKVSEVADLTKKNSENAVNALFTTISDALKDGESVQVIGFGNFETRDRAARKGRNPQTGAEIDIPASKVPAFKAGAHKFYRIMERKPSPKARLLYGESG
jgi:DNA-binding protein HU-beta